MNKKKKPSHLEVMNALDTLKRWHHVANAKGKTAQAYECKKIWDILKYFEETTDFRIM